MNKHFFLFWAFFFPLLAGAQNAMRTNAKNLQQAQKVMIAPGKNRAQEQVTNWAEETAENPANASAWVNFALWTQRNPGIRSAEKKVRLQHIEENAKAYIGSTGEWQLIRFLQSNKTDSAAIVLALDKISDKTIVYPFAIQSAIIRQNSSDLKKYCTAFASINTLSTSSTISQYHINVLQSAPDSATIVAMGENDLVPMALLQQTKNIRTDVRLVYYEPGVEKRYNKVHLCLTLGEEVLNQYRQQGAFRGLLLQLNNGELNNSIQSVIPAAVSLDYLLGNTFTGEMAQLHNNYLPGLLLAWRFCQKNNMPETSRYRQLIEKIAREGGKINIVSTLFTR